jgi:hypothetical protein
MNNEHATRTRTREACGWRSEGILRRSYVRVHTRATLEVYRVLIYISMHSTGYRAREDGTDPDEPPDPWQRS